MQIPDLMKEPDVPPERFFNMIDAGMDGTRAISVMMAALELNLFEYLNTSRTVPELAVLSGTDTTALGPVCQVLVSMDLLEQEGERYRNTQMASTFLDSASPFSQVHYLRKNETMIRDIWRRLPEVIRSGPVSFPAASFFPRISLRAMADNALCGRLQATIRPIIALPRFFRFRRMIDLGGGHGLYAIALTQCHPELHADVMDLPPVIPVLEEYISAYHAGRVHPMPGNFFVDPIGNGYAMVFSSSNPSGKSIDLIPRIAAALQDKGVFVNVQSDREGHRDPLLGLEWQLWTLGEESKGEERYTKEQPFLSGAYCNALEQGGLRMIKILDIPDNYHKGTTVTMMIAEKE
jgi:hypothetical protein